MVLMNKAILIFRSIEFYVRIVLCVFSIQKIEGCQSMLSEVNVWKASEINARRIIDISVLIAVMRHHK